MHQDLKKTSFGLDKKIETLFNNIIRSVGSSTHYVQQSCMSNLLVTVFAFRRQESLLVLKTFHPLIE